MRKKEQIKKINLSIVSICLFVIMCLGVSYAVFSYNKLGGNNQFLMGRLYLNYLEGSTVTFSNAFPETDDSARNNHGKKVATIDGKTYSISDNELIFSIEGVNESNKNYYFDFTLDYGDELEGKTRVDSKYIKYDFIRLTEDNKEEYLVRGKTLNALPDLCIYSDILSAYSEVPNTVYKIRLWVSNSLTYGFNGVYSEEEFSNLYLSIKMIVNAGSSQATKVYTGNIDTEIGNDLSNQVYEISFDKISNTKYLDYKKKFDGFIENDPNEIIRNVGDGVFEVYELQNNGTYKLNIVSPNASLPSDSSNLFTKFTNVRRIEFNGVDTSNVTDMSGMFKGLQHLYRVDISEFDTSKVTTMKEMFANSGIYDVTLGEMDISSLTDSSYMFYNCSMLSKIYIDPNADVDFGDVATNNDMVTNDYYLEGLLVKNNKYYGRYDASKLDGSYLSTDYNNQYYFTFSKTSTNTYTIPNDFYFDNSNYISNRSNMNSITNIEFVLLDLDVIQKLYNNSSFKFMIGDNIYAFKDTDNGTLYVASDGTIKTGINSGSVLGSYYVFSKDNYLYSRGNDSGSAGTYHSYFERMYLKNFDTSSSKSLSSLFAYALRLEHIDFESLDLSSATSLWGMFRNCASLEHVDEYFLNAPVCTEFGAMFYCCFDLNDLDLSMFDVSKASGEYGLNGFIGYCSSLDITDSNSIDLSFIDTSNVTSLNAFFAGIDFNGPAFIPDNFVLSNVNNYRGFLAYADYTSIDFGDVVFKNDSLLDYFFYYSPLERFTKEDLSFLPANASKLGHMFYGSDDLEYVDLSGMVYTHVNTSSNLLMIDFEYLFYMCDNLQEVVFPTFADQSYLLNFDYIFSNCSLLTKVSFRDMGRNYVTSLSYAFNNDTSLLDIDFANLVSPVHSLSSTFKNCSNLENIDLGKLFRYDDDYNNYSSLYNSYSSNVSLDFSFFGCNKLRSLDLRNFFSNTSTNYLFQNTFYNCNKITTIIVPYTLICDNFIPYTDDSLNNMIFYKCYDLVGSSGTKYNSSNVGCDMFRMDGIYADGRGGYLTVDWNYNNLYNSQSRINCYKVVNTNMQNFVFSIISEAYSDMSSYWGADDISQNSFRITHCDPSYISSLEGLGYTPYLVNNNSQYVYYKFNTTNRTFDIVSDLPLHFGAGVSFNGYLNYNIFSSSLNTYLNDTDLTNFINSIKLVALDSIDYSNINLKRMLNNLNKMEEFYGFAGQTFGNNVSFYGAFSACSSLEKIVMCSINATNLTDIGSCFSGCNSLAYVDFSFFNAPSLTSSYVGGWFNGCVSNVNIILYGATLNISNNNYFSSCSFPSNSILDFRHLKIYSISASRIFEFTHNTAVLDLTGMDVSRVTNMNYLFSGCDFVSRINGIEYFDVSNATTFEYAFQSFPNTTIDLSHWDVSSAISFAHMFKSASLSSITGLEKWNTGNVINMSGMFEESDLESVDIDHWDTHNVTDITSIFYNCNQIYSLGNVYNKLYWDTSKISNMATMFSGCGSLNRLDVSYFDTSHCTSFVGMFNNSRIEELNVSNFVFTGSTTNSLLSVTTSNVYGNDTHLIAKDWDFTRYRGTSYSTALLQGGYSYFDCSGWKLSPNIHTMLNMIVGLEYAKGVDVSGWEGWEYITSFNAPIITENALSDNSNFYIFIDRDLDASIAGDVPIISCKHLKTYYEDWDGIGHELIQPNLNVTGNYDPSYAVISNPYGEGYFTDIQFKDKVWEYRSFDGLPSICTEDV